MNITVLLNSYSVSSNQKEYQVYDIHIHACEGVQLYRTNIVYLGMHIHYSVGRF